VKEIKTKHPSASGFEHTTFLSLMDGNRWSIVALDLQAARVVSQLKYAMQLGKHNSPARRVLVVIDDSNLDIAVAKGYPDFLDAQSEHSHQGLSKPSFPCVNEDTLICRLNLTYEGDVLLGQLLELSHIFSQQAESHHGLLIHGALAEWGGYGVILAGPPDAGKTTASQRLRLPWRSLCDDMTLVVRDEDGAYWAHPWPTWSKFISDGSGVTWDVQRAVPLKGIFFLVQAQEDVVEPVRNAQAVCLLVETAESSSWLFSEDIQEDKARARRVQRFENIVALANSVPCYLLRLSLDGAFWVKIEGTI